MKFGDHGICHHYLTDFHDTWYTSNFSNLVIYINYAILWIYDMINILFCHIFKDMYPKALLISESYGQGHLILSFSEVFQVLFHKKPSFQPSSIFHNNSDTEYLHTMIAIHSDTWILMTLHGMNWSWVYYPGTDVWSNLWFIKNTCINVITHTLPNKSNRSGPVHHHFLSQHVNVTIPTDLRTCLQ